MQIDYDPTKISYNRLLDIFFTSHSCGASWSRQYRSAIFYADELQRRAAVDARGRYGNASKTPLSVDIEPLQHFHLAENYHQKYYLRQTDVVAEFERLYPDEADFVNSTAVARANAWAGGAGNKATLDVDLPRLGVSAGAQDKLRAMAR